MHKRFPYLLIGCALVLFPGPPSAAEVTEDAIDTLLNQIGTAIRQPMDARVDTRSSEETRPDREQQAAYWERYLGAIEHHLAGNGGPEVRAKLNRLRHELELLRTGERTGPRPGDKFLGGGYSQVVGRITRQDTGEPVGNALVMADSPNGYGGQALSNPDGTYSIEVRTPGTYTVLATFPELLDEVYDDHPCLVPLCDPFRIGDPLEVADGQLIEDIDFVLGVGGRISGTVSDEDSGEPIVGAEVTLLTLDGLAIRSSFSRDDGTYDILGLPTGTFLVRVISSSHQDELFDDVPCEAGLFADCVPAQGQEIRTTLDQTTQVDFQLDELGGISGTVTASETGLPIAGVMVEVLDGEGYYTVAEVLTGPLGTYRAGGLAPGNYVLKANHPDFQGELYDDIPCFMRIYCQDAATQVEVRIDQTTPDIDFALDPPSAIVGRVTDADTGEPIAGVDIRVAGILFLTQQDGTYRAPVPPGSHFVQAASSEYIDQLYDGIPCEDYRCDLGAGDLVELARGETVEGIDFALERSGAISGRITDAQSGDPILDFNLQLFDMAGQALLFSTATSELGRYEITDLQPGSYFLTASSYGRLGELWDDIPCEPGCDPLTGTAIEISAGVTADGIDFVLDPVPTGSISGRVLNVLTQGPLDHASVRIYDRDGIFINTAPTSAAGTYSVDGLPPGNYIALADHLDFVAELYPDIPCPGGLFLDCVPTQGGVIEVRAFETTEDVNFFLSPLSAIAGRVVDAGSQAPLAAMDIEVFDNNGFLVQHAHSNDAGEYLAGGLPPGIYFLRALDTSYPATYRPVLYDDQPCDEGACDPTRGTAVIVAPGETRDGIDFALPRRTDISDCVPSDTRLCLNEDRFAVDVRFTAPAPNGSTGPAKAVRITEDTGVFTFFDPNNVELVLKVLDACSTSFNSFWVFAAGLTNVEVEIAVTDTVTDTVQTYHNPLGQAFQPLQDTSAFATCDDMAQTPGPAPSPEALGLDLAHLLQALGNARPKAPGGLCTPSAERLCLNGGRFALEAEWERPNGQNGPAMAVPLTDDTGFFWFFTEQNLEAVVKVLDACGTPFDSFWVFAAGLTNLDVALRVTDTVAGATKTYRNLQGVPFAPIQDTRAFRTCP